MERSTPEQLSELISSDTLENLSFLELIEVSQTNSNKEVRVRAISLINNYDRNTRRKNILGFMDYIKERHENRFYKLHNSTTSIIELRLLRLQCIDTASIISDTPLNFDLVEDLKDSFKSFSIEYFEKNNNLLKNVDEKISYRLEKGKLAKSIPKKLDDIISILQKKFDGKLWLCKDVETLIKVFDFNNNNTERFRVIDKGHFSYFLHRLYHYLGNTETGMQDFYKPFLNRYKLSPGTLRSNSKATNKVIGREIDDCMQINDN